MSSKKIIRIKTPIKSRQQPKTTEPTQLSGLEFNQESTIMLVKNVACSEELQITLINEINKLYKEISKLRHSADNSSLKSEQTQKENKMLKSKMQTLEREYKMFKEKYELEKDNHQRLRKFYQTREKEWLNIVASHKKILQQCGNRGFNGISDIKLHPEFAQLESMYTNIEETLKSHLPAPREGGFTEKRERRKLRNSLEREDSLSEPKLKLKLNSQKETNLYKDMSQIHQQDRSPLKMKTDIDHSRIQQKVQISARNSQTDEVLDSILRKTYYKYKEKQMHVYDIEQLEDMVKLKNAKTSTRERLAKTIRKLDFQVVNEQEFKIFCESVERAVIEKYKILRGDYAFDLVIDKLRECQRLAMFSNSELSKLRTANPQREGEGKLKESGIYRSGKAIELLIDSTIKDDKTLEKIRKMSTEDDFCEKLKINVGISRKYE